MKKTALDFAPGTSKESKRLIGKLFTPTELLNAYRMARRQFGTGDLVLTVSEQDPSGFQADTRTGYIKKAKDLLGDRPMPLLLQGLVRQSAQAVMEMPFESDAMWFVVARGPSAVPVMCVLYGVPYEVEETDGAVAG